MKKHLIHDYDEGDEVKVRYDGETHFHTIQELTEKKVIFADGTEFEMNRKTRNNGKIHPSQNSDLTESLASATVIPNLY